MIPSPALEARRLAIMAAMHDELSALLELMTEARCHRVAGREFWFGRVNGVPVVAVLAQVGKVAAAVTVTTLIVRYHVAEVLFVGVAGGLGDGVAVGDVVVATDLLQHDMDASPLFPPFEVPLTGQSRFPTDTDMTRRLRRAADQAVMASDVLNARAAFGILERVARVHAGLVVSGDQFIASAQQAQSLVRRLPGVLAVEMEGAAVAQACAAFQVPFALVRTISDRADDSAHLDFAAFMRGVAAPSGAALVQAFLAGTRETDCP